MRRVRMSLAALLSTSLLLAGCGGGDEEQPESDQGGGESPAQPETWPFTGEEVGQGSAATKYPPLVVKVDNTGNSAPQLGLDRADLVVEEMVEGGVTRLAAIYHSTLPSKVGPVRSLRATDIGIAKPTGGALVASGGAGVTVKRIRQAGISIVNEGAPALTRASDRPAPYNVMADLGQVGKQASGKKAERPRDYLPFDDAEGLPKGKPATQVDVAYPSRTTSWAFRQGSYANTNTHAAGDQTFDADTVLVLRVDNGDAGYVDPAGNRVPESSFTGRGQAMLFHDGRVVRGTWRKQGLGKPVQLQTKQGDLAVPPGNTWVHLLPKQAGSVNARK